MGVFHSDQLATELSRDGKVSTTWLSDAGALTQFGALMQILRPGGTSALPHWHSDEDELVYVLSGEVTVHEADTRTSIGPGSVASFKAGTPIAHWLENRSTMDCTFLVVGTRSATDIISYPEHDRQCIRIRALPDDIWQTLSGEASASPY